MKIFFANTNRQIFHCFDDAELKRCTVRNTTDMKSVELHTYSSRFAFMYSLDKYKENNPSLTPTTDDEFSAAKLKVKELI